MHCCSKAVCPHPWMSSPWGALLLVGEETLSIWKSLSLNKCSKHRGLGRGCLSPQGPPRILHRRTAPTQSPCGRARLVAWPLPALNRLQLPQCGDPCTLPVRPIIDGLSQACNTESNNMWPMQGPSTSTSNLCANVATVHEVSKGTDSLLQQEGRSGVCLLACALCPNKGALLGHESKHWRPLTAVTQQEQPGRVGPLHEPTLQLLSDVITLTRP